MFALDIDQEIRLCLVHEKFASTYVRLATENYDYLTQWLPWPKTNKTEDDFKGFIQGALHKFADNKGITFAIEFKGEVVGNIALFDVNTPLKKAEIGYWIIESAQGNGLITRACHFLIDHAFTELDLEKIEIRAATENKPSRAVCERLGMKLEGVLTHQAVLNDKIVDHAIYGIHRA
ncbi:GNAT family protein [uncultured Endozoicomonas sp.]|uniref:GNAT family N-acetyltransferase n=1 Tax=uncultured Endozoicomonas sp. TaxID=432652 RepID=UPI00262F0079|nr:GNAT family protein [uncultured Endozoicomonas sp.]